MEIRIGSRIAEIELLSKDENQARLLIDGEEYVVDISALHYGVYSILIGGRSHNVELNYSEDTKSYSVVTTEGSHDVQIIDAKARYLRLRRGAEERQDDKIISPMPGKVVSIPVKVGDALKSGDTVVVIEAMKMQNSYKVASDCTIKEILVEEGEAINSNQLLIRLNLINE